MQLAGEYRKKLIQPGRLERSEVASGVVGIDAEYPGELSSSQRKFTSRRKGNNILGKID
jgi:hypothetical protein